MSATELTLTPPDSAWMREAACVGNWALMEGDSDYTERAAKELCAVCPVRQRCREWTLSLPPRQDVDGIAGGLTREERIKVRRSRRRGFRPRIEAAS